MESFLGLALQRRSIRKYKDEKIEADKVRTILSCALTSPSSKGCRPWEFVVVEDREVLSKLADCRTYGSQLLRNAPLGIVVAVDATLTDTWQCDGAIAAHNLLLAAEDNGLGACWVQIHNRGTSENTEAEQLAKQLLNIPEHLSVLCIVAIGYKDEERKPINMEKLQFEKVHYGKY